MTEFSDTDVISSCPTFGLIKSTAVWKTLMIDSEHEAETNKNKTA